MYTFLIYHLTLFVDRVSTEDGEGEAARYYFHARNLKQTIQFLRLNSSFKFENEDSNDSSSSASSSMCLPLDLLRCESLQSLDSGTTSRLLSKNYALLVSMAPLMNEIRPVGCFPPHLGPVIPEVTSIWFSNSEFFLFIRNEHSY